MHKFFIHKQIWVLFLLLPLSINAAEILSWHDCVALASQQNAEIKAAWDTLESAKNQASASKSGFWPAVSTDLKYNKNQNSGSGNSSSSIGSTGSNANAPYTASISATQNLFAGFQDAKKFEQATANARAAAANLKAVQAKINHDLKVTFEGLLYAKAYKTLTQAIIHRRSENLNLVSLRFDGGRENKGSVLLSGAYLSQAHYDDLQADNAKKVAEAGLARALGLDTFVNDDIVGEVPFSLPNSKPDFWAIAIAAPDFEQAQFEEAAAKAAIGMAQSPFFPSLTVTGSRSKQGEHFFPKDTNHWSVEVGVSLPLFNGGRDYYGEKSASAAWSQATHHRIDVHRQLLQKLEQAYGAYHEAVSKLKVDHTFTDAALLRTEIARKKYNNGLLSFEDWDLIENDLISRQKAYLQSKRDSVIAEAAWEQAIGKGLTP